ncbi:MAG: PilT/PilU family type 4a pilus ATPase [Clostridia bacterium]|nr:PilT/PilU family type 4a pilus ATPase [Clostridia bacterium]
MPLDPGMSPTIEKVINLAVANHASDVHFKAKQVPAIRINGEIMRLNFPVLTEEEIVAFTNFMCPRHDERSPLEARDFSWVHNGARFRVNVFLDGNGLCISMRYLYIPTTDFATLGIPEILKKMAERKSGMILITGPTGSGKTTTLTCLIDYINNTYPMHIVTLEDPIEYVHESKRSIISQREIGVTALSYEHAIVEALREDPDIIFVGEMRDRDSIRGALRAAETGHLVLSTLHTKGAANTVTRVVDIFTAEEQNQVRMQLSMCLLGVVSQQLVPRADHCGRVLATEVMMGTIPVQNLIRQQKIHMINSTLDLSSSEGMHTMKHSLQELLDIGLIGQKEYDAYQIV